MISVGGQWITSDDSCCVKSKPWKFGVWRSEAPGLWAPKFLQTSWREQSTMHVRKPFDMGGSWITILLLLFNECCMNLCSVCVVWIFGSKEGASGLTLDQASVMCCRPSPCNVEYYTSIDNIQSLGQDRENIYSIDQELVWNSEFSTRGSWATNPPSLASFWLRSYF